MYTFAVLAHVFRNAGCCCCVDMALVYMCVVDNAD